MTGRVSLVFACACLALAAGATSAAAAGWLPAADLSDANELVEGRPEVAVDAAGNAVAIWERYVGGEEVVEATERPVGGEWSEPETLSLPSEEGRRSQVAIDSAGNAIAVWVTGESSTHFVIRSALRPAGGAWSMPEDVSGPVQEAIPPSLEIDAAGETVVVWNAFAGGDRIIQGAVRTAAGWSDPDDLSADGQHTVGSPGVAIDAAGNATAVWARSNGSDDIVQAAVRPAGDDDWSAADDLSDTGENAREPQVAANAGGDAVAVWTRSNGTHDIVQAAARPASEDEWSEPEDLSAPGQHAEVAEVAIDEAGNAVAAWPRSDGLNSIIQAALRPAGDDQWSAPEDLSAAGRSAFSPAVAINDAVGAVAMWSRSDGSHLRVQASVRPPGDEWPKADTLSRPGEGAGLSDVAIDETGNAIAVFGRNGADGPFVQAAGYDFVAPRLDALQIPAGGIAGKPVAFAVSPFDMFPFATSWTFGDGQGATGNAVSHVYAAAGAYPVTVRAVDGGGNATTQTAAILIVPPGSPPPPPRRCQIALSLAIEGQSLARLLRTGKLSVGTTVSCAAEVVLSGRAKLRVQARGRSQAKLVPVFERKTVRFAAADERGVTLSLSRRGRKSLRPLSTVRLSIAGEASDGAGGIATATAARTLRGSGNAPD